MNIEGLSSEFYVRKINKSDIDKAYEFCSKNEKYYEYCPPLVTKESIVNDMNALPPGANPDNKYYLAYFDKDDDIVAMLDLILEIPDKESAFIGFFMLDKGRQRRGIGSKIIEDLSSELKKGGIKRIKLGIAEKNVEALSFWNKNGFKSTGEVDRSNSYNIILNEKFI